MIEDGEIGKYLFELGMVGGRKRRRDSHLELAISMQCGMGPYKRQTRSGAERCDIVDELAKALGQTRHYVSREMADWLERFRSVYDGRMGKYRDICNATVLEIITPTQFLYLLARDFDDKRAKSRGYASD